MRRERSHNHGNNLSRDWEGNWSVGYIFQLDRRGRELAKLESGHQGHTIAPQDGVRTTRWHKARVTSRRKMDSQKLLQDASINDSESSLNCLNFPPWRRCCNTIPTRGKLNKLRPKGAQLTQRSLRVLSPFPPGCRTIDRPTAAVV